MEYDNLSFVTGATTMAPAAAAAPPADPFAPVGEIPSVEWWDLPLVGQDKATGSAAASYLHLKIADAITALIEHPKPLYACCCGFVFCCLW